MNRRTLVLVTVLLVTTLLVIGCDLKMGRAPPIPTVVPPAAAEAENTPVPTTAPTATPLKAPTATPTPPKPTATLTPFQPTALVLSKVEGKVNVSGLNVRTGI